MYHRLHCLAIKDGTDRLSGNVGTYQSALGNDPEKLRLYLHRDGRMKPRILTDCSPLGCSYILYILTALWSGSPTSYKYICSYAAPLLIPIICRSLRTFQSGVTLLCHLQSMPFAVMSRQLLWRIYFAYCRNEMMQGQHTKQAHV